MANDARTGVGRDRGLVDSPAPRSEARIEDNRPPLSVEEILAWADAHRAAHGEWPTVGPGTVSGVVAGAPGESWKAINHALALGLRGLPGDSSLAELLAEHRGAPPLDMSPRAMADKVRAWEQEQFPIKGSRGRQEKAGYCPPLSINQILAWADAHHAAFGTWPNRHSGDVLGAPGDGWWTVDVKLRQGGRGLPFGSSIARLLREHRGIKGGHEIEQPLSIAQILAWADAYFASHGRWPDSESGPVDPPRPLTWGAIDMALRQGCRGVGPGLSLLKLYCQYRSAGPPGLI